MTGSMTADANGHRELPTTLEPGRYVLKPHIQYAGDPVELDLEEGMGTLQATVKIRGSSGLLVRARDPRGEPIDGLTVEASPLSAPIDPAIASTTWLPARPLGDGRYMLGPLEGGSYRVQARDDQNPAVEVALDGESPIELPPGAQREASVILTRDARITGRVVDAAGGPVADVWVGVERNEGGLRAMQTQLRRRLGAAGRVLSDRDGRFSLDGLVADARFDIRAEDFEGRSAQVPEVVPGQEVVLRLPAEPEPVAKNGW